MEELRECPFCGGEAEVIDWRWGGIGYWRVECTAVDCPTNPRTARHRSEAKAIEAWNTRADSEFGGIPCTEENMKAHGWIRERTCIREKHGTKMDGSPRLRCSLCGYGIGDKRFNYCPNCGAKVESE